MTLASRNVHDLVFRIVELGVVLWFPCVLWNSIRYGGEKGCRVCDGALIVTELCSELGCLRGRMSTELIFRNRFAVSGHEVVLYSIAS